MIRNCITWPDLPSFPRLDTGGEDISLLNALCLPYPNCDLAGEDPQVCNEEKLGVHVEQPGESISTSALDVDTTISTTKRAVIPTWVLAVVLFAANLKKRQRETRARFVQAQRDGKIRLTSEQLAAEIRRVANKVKMLRQWEEDRRRRIFAPMKRAAHASIWIHRMKTASARRIAYITQPCVRGPRSWAGSTSCDVHHLIANCIAATFSPRRAHFTFKRLRSVCKLWRAVYERSFFTQFLVRKDWPVSRLAEVMPPIPVIRRLVYFNKCMDQYAEILKFTGRSIREIVVSSNDGFTTEHLILAAIHCPNLDTLDISYCKVNASCILRFLNRSAPPTFRSLLLGDTDPFKPYESLAEASDRIVLLPYRGPREGETFPEVPHDEAVQTCSTTGSERDVDLARNQASAEAESPGSACDDLRNCISWPHLPSLPLLDTGGEDISLLNALYLPHRDIEISPSAETCSTTGSERDVDLAQNPPSAKAESPSPACDVMMRNCISWPDLPSFPRLDTGGEDISLLNALCLPYPNCDLAGEDPQVCNEEKLGVHVEQPGESISTSALDVDTTISTTKRAVIPTWVLAVVLFAANLKKRQRETRARFVQAQRDGKIRLTSEQLAAEIRRVANKVKMLRQWEEDRRRRIFAPMKRAAHASIWIHRMKTASARRIAYITQPCVRGPRSWAGSTSCDVHHLIANCIAATFSPRRAHFTFKRLRSVCKLWRAVYERSFFTQFLVRKDWPVSRLAEVMPPIPVIRRLVYFNKCMDQYAEILKFTGRSIREIVVSSNDGFTTEHLILAAIHCPNLDTLDISYCKVNASCILRFLNRSAPPTFRSLLLGDTDPFKPYESLAEASDRIVLLPYRGPREGETFPEVPHDEAVRMGLIDEDDNAPRSRQTPPRSLPPPPDWIHCFGEERGKFEFFKATRYGMEEWEWDSAAGAPVKKAISEAVGMGDARRGKYKRGKYVDPDQGKRHFSKNVERVGWEDSDALKVREGIESLCARMGWAVPDVKPPSPDAWPHVDEPEKRKKHKRRRGSKTADSEGRSSLVPLPETEMATPPIPRFKDFRSYRLSFGDLRKIVYAVVDWAPSVPRTFLSDEQLIWRLMQGAAITVHGRLMGADAEKVFNKCVELTGRGFYLVGGRGRERMYEGFVWERDSAVEGKEAWMC
ncbi:hypothetical protein HK104_007620 [Borealophlyctis nickersoniae]|nr:hypothetical protein HK104_007620 [Borealophlyctis nickersoniae]